jgi:hypothetical protein
VLPDLERAKTAVLNSLTSVSGQRMYDHAIREFVAWYCSEPRLSFNRTVMLRRTVAAGTVFSNSAAQEGAAFHPRTHRVVPTAPCAYRHFANVPSVPTESTTYASLAIDHSTGFSQGARNGRNAWIEAERPQTGRNVVGISSVGDQSISNRDSSFLVT